MLGCLRVGSAQTNVHATTQRQKFQIKFAISPTHTILTPGQPVSADPLTPGGWQGSRWSPVSSDWNDTTQKKPHKESEYRTQVCGSQGGPLTIRLTRQSSIRSRSLCWLDRYLQGCHSYGPEAFIGWTGIYKAVTHTDQKSLLAGQEFTRQSLIRSRSLYSMDRYLQGSHPYRPEAFIGWTGIYRAVTHKKQKPLFAGQVFTGQSPIRSRSLYWLDRYLQGSHPYRPEAFIGWTGIYRAVTCKEQKPLFTGQVTCKAVTCKEQKLLFNGQVFTRQSPVRSRSLCSMDRYLQGSHL